MNNLLEKYQALSKQGKTIFIGNVVHVLMAIFVLLGGGFYNVALVYAFFSMALAALVVNISAEKRYSGWIETYGSYKPRNRTSMLGYHFLLIASFAFVGSFVIASLLIIAMILYLGNDVQIEEFHNEKGKES